MRRIALIAAAAFAVPVFTASAALPETGSALSGAAYIRSIQSPGGAYGSTDLGQNIDAVFAVRSAGYDPAKDLVAGDGPVQFLTANASKATSPAAAAKAALGAKALGLDPKSTGGIDFIARINGAFDAAKGTYGSDDFSQSIAMLGLACTGNSVPASAVAALKATQIVDNGGWGFGGFADPDTTAIAVQALLAAGAPKTDTVLVKALAYLKSVQGDNGGWGFDPSDPNASSTAYVIQALLALGEDPDGAAYAKSGVTPVDFLVSQQQADGSFKGFDAAYATNQALPALAGRTFCSAPETPITRVRPVVTPTPAPTVPPPPPTAPKPPSTGTGPVRGASHSLVALAGAALIVVSIASGLVARRRG